MTGSGAAMVQSGAQAGAGTVSAARYGTAEGRILVSGTQALIRLLIEQSARDRASGLNTAGYVSGYRGSPLAGFDREIEKAGPALAGTDIVFQPGLNEDLAATAVWGTQQLGFSPGARHEGVFALWYGKGPGIDRSMDAIRHANAAGTAPKGGVVLLMGDDHAAVSSTLPHQSEHNLISAMVPILSPTGVDDYVAIGLHAIAMSRFSGAWVGMKCQTEIVECSSTLTLPPRDWRPALPEFEMPPGGLSIRWPDAQLAQEARLEVKLRAAQAYARANGLDSITGAAPARLGIVATGKAWRDLMGAFALLDLTPEQAGIRVLKLGLIWPVDPQVLHQFRAGLQDILIVEEKRPVIEDQIRALFYGLPEAPRLWGKTTPDGAPLLSAHAEFDAGTVAAAVQRTFGLGPGAGHNAAPVEPAPPELPLREPYFCSGCPHSVSTRLPSGSRAIAGIGCSMLAVSMKRNVETFTQMGGEGANWIGVAPFTDERHIFVHMGDGTYFHSGLLAIRAAVAAKVTATYKILFNDAVAMTGGQPHDGELSVPVITRQLLAEGLAEVVVISERPELLQGQLPGGIRLLHRDHILAEQERLAQVPGVTAIVYDQVCAAEKRRRRKRGTYPAAPVAVAINPAVCEGCGDCSVQSNCISVEPFETPLGTKRRINSSTCNVDLSCTKGFCPSFVTISGTRKKAAPAPMPDFAGLTLPDPPRPPVTPAWSLLLTGIGGTGVITVSAVLAQAAHLDGLAVLALDQTGLAQKNGAVASHLHFAETEAGLTTPRIGAGEADALLAFDTVVAAGPKALRTTAPGRTRVVADAHVTPTAGFVRDSRAPQHLDLPLARLRARVGAANLSVADATGVALRHFGDGIAANILLTGHAFQMGLIPLSQASIEAAIRLNGAGVATNLAAFAAGRWLALYPERFAAPEAAPDPQDRAALKARHVAALTAWQNARYARRYLRLIDRAEARLARAGAGAEPFLLALMRGAHHVMAYKDEYEVARLHSDPAFLESLAAGYEGAPRISFHLAPPVLPGRDLRTGRPRKREFGPWMLPVFRGLARMRHLRGTPLDLFGLSRERREERRLREEYLAAMDRLVDGFDPTPEALQAATAQAAAVLAVVGFGPVKAANLARFRAGAVL